MSDHWDDQELDAPRRRRRGRRSREAEAEWRDEEPDVLLSPEERAWRRAERVAEEKTRLVSEDLWVLGICFVLLLLVFPVGLIVTLVWGRRPLKRAYRLFVEPRLRDRFIEQEVESQVAATLTHERQALESEHARSMQQLSASIAHEIRNPITAAKSLVQQMEEDPQRAENVEYARVALEELQRVERSVSHLLRFARDEELGHSELRLADVIDSALETFRDRLERTGIALDRHIDAEGWLRGDAEKLRRVVINLVGNAIDALDEGATREPRVEVAMGENLAGTEVWVRVKDNGPGIDPEIQDRLFSPFQTSKTNGTGLGLAICRKVVDAHGGSIEVSSEPGHGAEFLLTFPKLPQPREGGR
ncbi:MAG: HAMP domain-containing sensor histidine kinase [Myxococcota bacterium]|nr:HAMP domain-containing sensor histidine kinase [Myxococcota bacterium]